MPKENAKKIKSVLSKREKLSIFTGIFVISLFLVFGVYFVASQTENLSEPKSASTCSGVELQSGCFELERATTNEQRILGLSNRVSLPSSSGMLFVFETSEEQCFWMKDMKFNIDILWLNEKKQITKIEKDVTPQTYPETFCQPDTKYVLEFNAGTISANGLKVGSTLQF